MKIWYHEECAVMKNKLFALYVGILFFIMCIDSQGVKPDEEEVAIGEGQRTQNNMSGQANNRFMEVMIRYIDLDRSCVQVQESPFGEYRLFFEPGGRFHCYAAGNSHEQELSKEQQSEAEARRNYCLALYRVATNLIASGMKYY